MQIVYPHFTQFGSQALPQRSAFVTYALGKWYLLVFQPPSPVGHAAAIPGRSTEAGPWPQARPLAHKPPGSASSLNTAWRFFPPFRTWENEPIGHGSWMAADDPSQLAAERVRRQEHEWTPFSP